MWILTKCCTWRWAMVWRWSGRRLTTRCFVSTSSTAVRWQFRTDAPVRLVPTYADGRVYFGADDGYVYCLRGADGQLVWKLRAGPSDQRLLARGRMISRWPVRTGVVVDDQVAYFGAGVLPHEGVYLCAAHAEDGTVLWRNDTISQQDAGRNPLSPQGYLLLSDERLIVPSGRSLPAAFDRQTGRELYQRSHSWRTTAGGVVGGAKAVLADDQVYASGPHHFLALDEKSGGVGFAWIDGRQLVISDTRAFVADGRQVMALDRQAHAKATIQRQKQRLALADLTANRTLDAQTKRTRQELTDSINTLSGTGVLWQADCPLDSALIAGGSCIYAGGQGRVVALDAQTGQELWAADVEGEVGGLAVASGHLFASTTAGRIYCFAAASALADGSQPTQLPASAERNPFPDDAQADVYGQAADRILERSGVSRGYCLVLGSQRGRLAYELARRSELRIYGVESDPDLVAQSQQSLARAGLWGTRVTILQAGEDALPFSNYFANLIVSDQFLTSGELAAAPSEVVRCLKPCGGVLCLVAPGEGAAGRQTDYASQMHTHLDAVNLALGGRVETAKDAISLERGVLPGVGNWSHQYGDAANTMTSSDERVRGDLGVLWYGDPGPSKMVNRHDAAVAPLSTAGRMFVQGVDSIMAYDAYNGLFLWEFANPGAVRTGVFNNEDTSNFAASDEQVFSVVDDACTVLDAATGKPLSMLTVPPSEDGLKRIWGYVAHDQGTLYGTSTLPQELEQARRRRGLQVAKATDSLFAVDVATGQRKWVYRGGSIEHVTIAIGDGRVFFIDSSITREEREALLRARQIGTAEPAAGRGGQERSGAESIRCAAGRLPGRRDGREAVGARRGRDRLQSRGHRWRESDADVPRRSRGDLWSQRERSLLAPVPVRPVQSTATGGARRRTGEKLWAKDANYRHRPIIVGDEVFAEPWAFNLHTGAEKMREHPVTGEQTVWQFSRPGHHCGPVTATPNMLFFRSGFTGYYDLYADSGTTHFAGQRLGCWVNAIPGNGLLMVPEASAGCVCQFSLAATIVMEPRTDRQSWRIYSAGGDNTPVRHLAVNFGAPGDRRDQHGTLWVAYPRPQTVGRLEYLLPLQVQFAGKEQTYQVNDQAVVVQDSAVPWVLTSGVRGLKRCDVPLLGDQDAAANYRVNCHFAVLEDSADATAAAFQIKLQGIVVADSVDVLRDAGGARRELVLTFEHIPVTKNLVLELVPLGEQLPTIAGVEIVRE